MRTKARKKERAVPGIFRLTNRGVIFLTCTLAVSAVFYVTGSLDHFLDGNLLLILWVVQAFSVMDLVFCVASVVQSLFFSIFYRDLYYLLFVVPVLSSAALSVACFAASGAISVVSRGT